MNEIPVRLLLLSPLPPPPGGIATWTQTLIGSPWLRGVSPEVFNTSLPEGEGLPGAPSRLRPRRILSGIALLTRFAMCLRKRRPQVVHISSSYYWALPRDLLLLTIAQCSGSAVCFHLHGGDFSESLTALPRWVRNLALVWLGTADAVIVMTRSIERNLQEVLRRERVHYMPNFVGLIPLREHPRRCSEVLGVLFVGAVVEAKGILDLLEAVRGVPGSHVRVAGPISRELEYLLSGLIPRIGGRVELLGSVSHERVAQLLCESDVFVLPTHREGFPISLLEAMSAGLAVVTTPVGAIPEIVRDGIDGILVPPGDVGALRTAIERLAGDPGLRSQLGAQAAARVASEFHDSVVVPRLAALYRQLAGVESE